ncbi:MAG: glycosyltransferase [Spirochaetota bacterium]|jgi:GT2 family glycosyltransferase|nr:glycosyltransferase [Spirochaetota bacterium]
MKRSAEPCALSVVVPAYNEAPRIARTIREIFSCLKAFPHAFEVIIVDDGSHDRTAGEAEAAIKSMRVRARVIAYTPNQGKGWALRQGILAARGKHIAFFDADLDIAPQHIIDYYRVLQQEKADAVIASKRHPDSQLVYAKSRVIISSIYYWFNRIVFRLDTKDTQTGMKLFRREILLTVLPRLLGKRFAFDLELLVNIRRIGGRIISQPVVITGHEKFGRIGFPALWHAFVDTLAIAYRVYILRYYDWRVMPKIPAPGAAPDQSAIALCILSSGYGRRLEELCAHLRDTCGLTNPILIITPKGGFTLRDARIIVHPAGDQVLSAVAEYTSAEAVVFLDERSRPSSVWISQLAAYMELRSIDAVTGPLGGFAGQSRASLFTMSVMQHILMTYFHVSRWNRVRQHWRNSAAITNLCVRTQALRGKAFGTVFDGRVFSREKSILYSPDCVLGYAPPLVGWEAARELYRVSRRRGQRQLHRPPHLFCLRDYFPAFFLIVLVIGGIFSCISEIFWIYWRWLIVVWAAIAYLTTGHFFKIHKALMTAAGVFLGNIISGFGFIRGLFAAKKELSDDE